MSLNALDGQARQGSILNAPFTDGAFDFVVAIGCYHHTGNLQKALDKSHRVLRRGGSLIFMIYNGLSYRQWHEDWMGTLRQMLTWRAAAASERMRARYDTAAGEAAPHTDFVSRARLRRMCRNFSHFRSTIENITNEPPFERWTREQLFRDSAAAVCWS